MFHNVLKFSVIVSIHMINLIVSLVILIMIVRHVNKLGWYWVNILKTIGMALFTNGHTKYFIS